jgi:hypothetical protein
MTVIDVQAPMFTPKWLKLLKSEGGQYNIKTRLDGQTEIATGIDVTVVSFTCLQSRRLKAPTPLNFSTLIKF